MGADPTNNPVPGPPERTPELHVRFTGGPGRAQWQVRCGTCGWSLRGTGDSTPMDAAAIAHRCPPPDELSP